MSLSENLSSSAQSLHTLVLNDSDTLERITSKTDSELSSIEQVPIMMSRQHVLDDMPEDVQLYWLYKYVLNWDASDPKNIAKVLHHMAMISKSHQIEVQNVLANEPEISLAYTAHAMRVLAETAIALPPKERLRVRRHLEATVPVVNEAEINVYNFGKKVKKHLLLSISARVDFSFFPRQSLTANLTILS